MSEGRPFFWVFPQKVDHASSQILQLLDRVGGALSQVCHGYIKSWQKLSYFRWTCCSLTEAVSHQSCFAETFHNRSFHLSIFCYCIGDAFRAQGPFRYMILLHDGVTSVQHSIIMKTRKNGMKHRWKNSIHAITDVTQTTFKFKYLRCYSAIVLWVSVGIASLGICWGTWVT